MATDFVDENDDPHARAPIEGGEPRPRILLVDDDPATLLIIEQAVRDADMEVVATTYDGEHALDLARQLQPDLALIDWDMPHYGGALTARLMRRYVPDVTPVLLLGRSDFGEVDTAGSKARFSAIPKGSDPTELREQLNTFHHRDAFAAPPQDPVSRPG